VGAVKEEFSLSLVIEPHLFSLPALNLFCVHTELKYLALSFMAINIIIISNLSNNRSKASSKTIPPHSVI